MANTVRFEFAAKTDTGLVRSQNEDSIAIDPECGFAVIADGMGGYSAGEVASGIATAVVTRILEEGIATAGDRNQVGALPSQIHQLMVDAIHYANAAILETACKQPECRGMGTTLLACVLHHDKITVAHVGDSRAYRFRQRELVQISRDHSLLQEQIDAGIISPELAHYSQYKNLVTRAVGVGPDMEVEIHDHHTHPGDVYLLCSDGLSDMLLPSEIQEVLVDKCASLQRVCDCLVKKANDNGGHDNISVILIRVLPETVEAESLLGRLRGWMK